MTFRKEGHAWHVILTRLSRGRETPGWVICQNEVVSHPSGFWIQLQVLSASNSGRRRRRVYFVFHFEEHFPFSFLFSKHCTWTMSLSVYD